MLFFEPCDLGRFDAVGAGRELPALPRVPAPNPRSDVACRVAVIIMPRRDKDFYSLARLAVASSVEAVPSVASARPPPSASVIKTRVSMGGMVRAWRRRQWRHLNRNTTRNGIPANADCRGGGFATRRFPRPLSPCSATVFVATWRAAVI